MRSLSPTPPAPEALALYQTPADVAYYLTEAPELDDRAAADLLLTVERDLSLRHDAAAWALIAGRCRAQAHTVAEIASARREFLALCGDARTRRAVQEGLAERALSLLEREACR